MSGSCLCAEGRAYQSLHLINGLESRKESINGSDSVPVYPSFSFLLFQFPELYNLVLRYPKP